MTRFASVLAFVPWLLPREAWAYIPSYGNTSCLLWQGDGCENIREETLCVNSRDGMAHDLFGNVRLGKPCAWHKAGVCARVDDWTRQQESPSDFTVAKCKEGASIDDTIAVVKPPAASQGQFSSDTRAHMPWSKADLMPMDGGSDRACRGVMQTQTGHVARLYNIWTASNINDCKALCTGSCKGVEFQAENQYCEVWYGDVLFSTENPGFECYVRKDQDQAAKLALVKPKDQSCLRAEPEGCAALKDRFSCLSSKDGSGKEDVYGLQVHDEPCVWCGGGLCHTGGLSMCEPFDYLLRGAGKDHAFGSFTASGIFETPSCEEGQASVFAQSDTWWQPDRPLEAEIQELAPVTGGCQSVQDMATCLSSKDASPNATWGYTPYKVQGEACVWCGGVPCTDASASLCMPFDLVMNGQGPHHDTFYAKHSFKVAAIKESQVVVGADVDVQCLSPDNDGCNTLTDAFKCLASVDGRPNETIFGRKVKGQPCVWCNGRNCNSEGGLCEAYDLQMNGESYVFATSFDKNPMVAQCEAGMVKAHPHVHSAVLALPEPKMEELGCLNVEPAGCMAITDKIHCLSSVDGSVGASYGGLRIRGQPCVWCGGTSCTNGGSFKCAPYEYLAKGATKVFPHVTAVSATVAQCHATSRSFPEEETACLKIAETGCNEIHDMATCVSSKEGRPYEYIAGFKVKGEPCVWCGGGQCNSGSITSCEPYDWAVNGAGHVFANQMSTSLYSRAACDKDGQPGPVQLPSQMEVHGFHQSVQCGHPNPVWMKVGKTCGFCKVLVPSIKEQFATCADYCASQGGLQCKSAAFGSLDSCDVKQAATCDTNFEVYGHAICECQPPESPFKAANEAFAGSVSAPKADDMKCLNSVETGCGSIKDKLICLSSMDGSPNATYRSTKIAGQPCAWCGGVACTSHDPSVMCVALDFLVNGQGPAYATRHIAAPSVDVAGCDKAKTARNFGDVTCLKRVEDGCNTLKDRNTCLQSVDGRPFAQVAGLKVEGQPCVWCGGLPCTSNNGNLCEPYEFATHGEGHAYDFNNDNNYYSAACEGGEPVQHTMSSAVAMAGVTAAVDCGMPFPLWRGVSKTCGFCQVLVAMEAAKSYLNCESYCQAQGGMACTKAFSGSLHSCDLGPAMSCTAEFPKDISPICECAAPSVKENDVNIKFVETVARPAEAETMCLMPAEKGCSALHSRDACLSSKDASAESYRGLKMAGEPCVWCGGAPCTSHSEAKCAPYDFLAGGQGLAFQTRQAASVMDVAHCKEASRTWENVGCLARATDGCHSLTEKDACLSHVDGRPYAQIAGLKVEGQPCVWCGGTACHEKGTMCEPYEYAMQGDGHAFDASAAKSTFFTAACEDGKPVEHRVSSALVEAGLPLQVDCGVPNPTWDKVGKTCGFCKVQVAKEAASTFKTCDAYCKGQGNLTCAGAWSAHPYSCDVASTKACAAEFTDDQWPLCQCNAPAATVAASSAAFDLPRPAEAELACLYTAEQGCSALDNELDCLGNKDGSSVTDIKGLKVQGEPCVWCAGGPCTDYSASKCVTYDFLARGQGLAFTARASPIAAEVAKCKTHHRPFGDTKCLKRVTEGCNTIQEQKACLASYDGRPYTQIRGFKVEGQPCIWCGGVPCTSGGNLCEPYEFGKYSAESAVWYTATCENGEPVEHEIPSNFANYGQTIHVNCGTPEPVWYKVGKECGFCKVQVAAMAASGYKNCDTYCRAQPGNLTCKAAFKGAKHSCDEQSAMACSDPFPADTAPICECNPAFGKAVTVQPRPSEANMKCLRTEGLGCSAVSDRLNCLSSKDASDKVAVAGLKIQGEPCVWCADGPCTSNSASQCAPYDWFVRGEGVAFTTNLATANFIVADCKADSDAAMDNSNVQCLAKHTSGCNSIQDEQTCLSSLDGRPYEFVAGYKAAGQPCVWCGGGACTSQNDNKCEPYDYVVNGAGHAFQTFHATGLWKMAACEGGRVVAHALPSSFTHGTNLQVQCGYGPLAVWTHTSRTCGECQVNVPQMKDNFATCQHYCERQPGAPKCLGAAIAHHPNSCDVHTPAACDYEFKKEEDGICKCSVVKPPHERVQKLYAQCGGKNWKGYVQCQVGAICNVVNDWYSQCQPSLSAKPGVKINPFGADSETVLGVDEEEVAASMAAGAGAAIETPKAAPTVVVTPKAAPSVVVSPVVAPVVAAPVVAPPKPKAVPVVAPPTPKAAVLTTPSLDMLAAEGDIVLTTAALPEVTTPKPVALPKLTTPEPPKPVALPELTTPEPPTPVSVATPETSMIPAVAAAEQAKAGYIAVTPGPSEPAVPTEAAATVAPAATEAPAATVAPVAAVPATTVAPVAATLPPLSTVAPLAPVAIRAKDATDQSSAIAETTDTEASTTKMPHSVQAGLNAAALKRDDHGSVAEQAVSAAATAGAYEVANYGSSQQKAQEKALQAAVSVFEDVGGLPDAQATVEGEKALKTALEQVGGKFEGPDLLQRHGFADCWEPCGKKAGYCSDFCGRGNACCRKTGDIVVPTECMNVYSFYTPHYECIKPTAIYMPTQIKAKETAANSTEVVVEGEVVVEDASAAAQLDDNFTTGQWVLIAATILALLCAGVVCWTLSEGNKRSVPLKMTRSVEVASPTSTGADLELQAPLTAGAALGAVAAPVVSAAPMVTQQYRFLPGGTSQGYQAAPMDDGLVAAAQPITTGMISTPVPMAGAVYYPSTQVAYAPLAASVATVATSTPVPMEPMMAAGSSAVQGPPTQCPACGNIYAIDSVFCRKCGMKRPEH